MTPVAAIQQYPQFKGRLHFMRRPIGARWLERLLFGRYYRAGLGIIPKRNSMGFVLDTLSKNETIIFIMDQYAKTSKEGIAVDFFGKPAGTFRSLALVAKRSGAPVVPSYSYRAADGTHVMEFWPALAWIEDDDSDREIHANTRQYNAAIEDMVRAHPDQWWWPHRRWKVK
jgi:KDO2-lipid IV(A) lauroyltransferase